MENKFHIHAFNMITLACVFYIINNFGMLVGVPLCVVCVYFFMAVTNMGND